MPSTTRLLSACILSVLLPVAASAQETAAAADGGMGVAGIMFNTSIGVNVYMASSDPEASQVEEDGYRRSLYQRSINECAILLESVAKACEVTSVSISTQINSNPGQPDYLYATSNITMQVELK
jgi:hypothetical protein